MKAVFPLLFCFLVLIGCKKNDAAVAQTEDMMTLQVPSKAAGYASEDKNIAVASYKKEGNNASEEATIEQKIIKTANLRFETEETEETFQSVQALVKKYKASIQNDSEGKDDYSMYRRLTIRIPNANFDAFIGDLSKGVDYFDQKDIAIDDVTEEYIDVASRIKTKKALEQRYLELLNKANKVSEMLEIEQQLATIREEIEAKEGRLKYLQNQVSMSTITMEFYKTLEHKAGATVSFGTKFVNAIKSGFNGISSFFIWLIEVWPFIVILVALIYFIRRRIKRKNK